MLQEGLLLSSIGFVRNIMLSDFIPGVNDVQLFALSNETVLTEQGNTQDTVYRANRMITTIKFMCLVDILLVWNFSTRVSDSVTPEQGYKGSPKHDSVSISSL